MRLNLPNDASISDIYKNVLEITIENSLVKIPDDKLEEYHQIVLNDLFSNNTHPEDELQNISSYFQQAKVENRKHGKKNLTFDTFDVCRGRYSRFRKEPDNGEIIKVNGYDPTNKSLRHAVGHFGNDFCSIMGGFWGELADKAVSSSLSFETLLSNKVLTRSHIDATSYAKLDLKSTASNYAYPAVTTLYFHDPKVFNKTESFKFKFVKKTCSYGDNKLIEVTLLKLRSSTKFIARARAEYEISVKKGLRVNTWAKVLSLGINCLFDQEKTMDFSSDQFTVDFECRPHWFKIKQKSVIVISKEVANEFLNLEKTMRQYQERLELKNEKKELEYHGKAAIDEAHQMLKEDEFNQEEELILETLERSIDGVSKILQIEKVENEIDAANRWKLSIIVNGAKKEFDVKIVPKNENCLKNLVLEITTRDEALSHMDEAMKRTASVKKSIILKMETDGKTVAATRQKMRNVETRVDKLKEIIQSKKVQRDRAIGNTKIDLTKDVEQLAETCRNLEQEMSRELADLNCLCGEAFEEIVNARIMAKAAEHGVPLKFIEGDGKGQYINSAGDLVKTPEFVDAMFFNEATGETISIQYKFSNKQWKLNELKKNWEKTWEGKDLTNIDLVAPKEVDHGGNFKDHIKLSDDIIVSAPSVEEVSLRMDSNFDKIKKLIKEGRSPAIRRQLENLEKKVDGSKQMIQSIEEQRVQTVGKKKSGLTKGIKNIEKKVKKLEEDMSKLSEEVQKSDTRYENLIKEDGINPIPGLDDELVTHVNTKLELKRKIEKLKRIKEAQKELKASIGIAFVISTSTELICSLVDEFTLSRSGKQSVGEAALNVLTRTSKAAAVGTGIAAVFGGVQYGLTRLALSESTKVAIIGKYGSKIFGPAVLLGALSYQSYGIIKQYNIDKHLSASFARRRMAIDFSRMTGVTVGSIGSFAVAAACIASGPVALTVGAVCCIVIGVSDHMLGKYLNLDDEAAMLEYKELKDKVVDKAYALFDLESRCSNKELKKAYQTALLKYHPDKAVNKDEANEITCAIVAAYTLLKAIRTE